MDTFEKLEYRIKAGIREAKDEKTRRLSDRVKLPLKGLHGEDIFITDLKKLEHNLTVCKAADISEIDMTADSYSRTYGTWRYEVWIDHRN